jgi:hypothetical protein
MHGLKLILLFLRPRLFKKKLLASRMRVIAFNPEEL